MSEEPKGPMGQMGYPRQGSPWGPGRRMVALDYFRPDGTWWCSAVLWTEETDPTKVAQDVRELRDKGESPGLAATDRRPYIVLIRMPKDEYCPPQLVV